MASKDRIKRLKEDTRVNILDASMSIVKSDGWNALSMRKIADEIEYTAPIIYEYFKSKEDILQELTKKGFLMLAEKMKQAKDKHRLPAKQLEAMWLAYWNFGFAEKELYQVMFGVGASLCEMAETMPEVGIHTTLLCDIIADIMELDPDDHHVCRTYYTFWSVVHGLISINLVGKANSDEINRQVLKTAITGIIRSIEK